MRRPAVFSAAAFGAGILIAYNSKADPFIWIIIITAMMAFCFYVAIYVKIETVMKFTAMICIAALGAAWLAIGELTPDPLIEKAGSAVEIKGFIKNVEYKNNMYNITLKNNDSTVLIKYYSEDNSFKNSRGKYLCAYGKLELPQQRRNPACFDYRSYLRSCGISTIMTAEYVGYMNKAPVGYLVLTGMIRSMFEERLQMSSAAEKTGLIMGIMFGDKSQLDEELYSDFQRNGTAHVLAVSGLHTGILYAFFSFLWRGKKGTFFYVMTCAILLLYMALADFSPSVVRASCMIILHIVACITRNRYDLLSAAGTTFILMLIINPYQIFHSGFQLSFLAIASLGVILPFINYFYQGILLSSLAIQAGMIPYNAYLFNYISAGALIANIPVVFIAGVVLPAGLCSVVAMFFSEKIFSFLMEVMNIGCSLLIRINEIFYASGKTSFDVVSPPVWALVLYYGIIFLCLCETGQLLFLRKNIKAIATAAAAVCLVAVISVPVMRSPLSGAEVVFLDVGQGDCIHVKTNDGKNYLIDGGGSADYDTGMKILKPYLLKNGVKKIDIAFVSHLHEDHYGGIRSLAADGMIEKVAVYEANRQIEEQLKSEMTAEIIYLYGGHRVNLGKECFIEVISPEPGTSEKYSEMIGNSQDENDTSLIMRLNYKGMTTLITGDIDQEGELNLIEKYGQKLDSDVMKVPHHGSKYSSSGEFIKAVSPVLAVFQVGRNNYGHPAPETVKKYEASGCMTVRNDICGAIGLDFKEGSFKVVRMIH